MENKFVAITYSNGECQSFAHNLKELNIIDNSFIKNLDVFVTFKEIEKITLSNCENLIDISSLSAFKKLRRLTIINCNAITDLSTLNLVYSLRRLKCSFNSLDVIDTLRENHNLKYLTLSERFGVSKFDLVKTEDLIVKFRTPNISNLKPIQSLTNVTHLEIKDSKNLIKIDNLKQFNKLQFIFLSNCSNLEDINSIKSLPVLKQFEISTFCNKLDNIEFVFEVKELEEIRIIECLGIDNIVIKKINRRINTILLAGCRNINQIQNILNLKALKLLQIE